MKKIDRASARHLLMRVVLAFVLGWFGIHELHAPGDWAVFVPSFVANNTPVAVNDLILVHGFLLVLAAAFVLLGVLYVVGALLATALMAEVIFGLWLDSGISDVLIRDVGVLGLAAGLALDPVRFWHLETVLPSLVAGQKAPPPVKGKKGAPPVPQPRTRAPQVAGSVALVGVVLALALVLHVTGSSGSSVLPSNSIASASNGSGASSSTGSAAAAATPAPPPAAAAATPGSSQEPATSQKFDDWRYKRYSYQIYPGPVSGDAQSAASGFDVSTQDQGDKVTINLKATDSRYRDAQMTILKTDKAYFVETSMRDDPSGGENELNDDGLIAVNTQGYILSRNAGG